MSLSGHQGGKNTYFTNSQLWPMTLVGVPDEKASQGPWEQHSHPMWRGFKVDISEEIAQVLDCGPDAKVDKSNAFLP